MQGRQVLSLKAAVAQWIEHLSSEQVIIRFTESRTGRHSSLNAAIPQALRGMCTTVKSWYEVER